MKFKKLLWIGLGFFLVDVIIDSYIILFKPAVINQFLLSVASIPTLIALVFFIIFIIKLGGLLDGLSERLEEEKI